MFSYYGRKSKLIDLYPKPTKDTIIEPFDGSAVYALNGNNWEKDVIIVDKYEVVIKIWQYLQQASVEDILSLPNFKKGDKVTDHQHLTKQEKWLIGFCINRGNSTPVITASNYNSWDKDKVRIANDLHKIRHWDIRLGSYVGIENINATWYIDPPYQKMGKYYKHNGDGIDFMHLSKWCKEREGQVIVCENKGADWLEFQDLKVFRGSAKTNTEVMFYNESQNEK